MAIQSYFASQTHGKIPLSKRARALMEELREAVTKGIEGGTYIDSIAHARGELASYMSNLEQHAEVNQTIGQDEPVRPKTINETGMDPGKLALDIEARSPLMYSGTKQKYRWDVYRDVWPHLGITEEARINAGIDFKTATKKENAMAKKKAAAAKKAATKLTTVGIRFITGGNLAKVYTYKAKRSAKLHLGQEMVVHNDHGSSIGVVVSLDGPIPAGYSFDGLVELTHKVSPL